MRLDCSTGLLENARFSGVKSGKVSLPRRNLGQRQPGNLLGSVKASSRFEGSRRFPVSQLEAVVADVVHESGARPMGPGIKRALQKSPRRCRAKWPW
jgi:hypothetical protein